MVFQSHTILIAKWTKAPWDQTNILAKWHIWFHSTTFTQCVALCWSGSSRIYVTEYFKSFITVVRRICSRHVLCATRFGTRPAVVHYVHCWSRREGRWARRQLSHFCRRYAAEWALSLRWYADCCWETWTLCHRYQSLNVGTPPQAKYKEDRTPVVGFQVQSE